MINSNDINKIARYFDIASAYVPNQFSVFVYKRSAVAQYDRKPNPHNPLYLINLEPWVIENVTFPQINFIQADDIYVDSSSLVKPKYIKAVETSGNIEITLREKSDLAIYRSLIRCQTEMFNNKYEYDGINHFGMDYAIVVRMKSQRFDNNTSESENIFGDNVITFDRVILTNISTPKLEHSSREFLRYTVTFETSSMAESYKALSGGKRSDVTMNFGNPKSSVGVTSNVKDRTQSSINLSNSSKGLLSNTVVDGWIDGVARDITNVAYVGVNNTAKSLVTPDTAQTNEAIRKIQEDAEDALGNQIDSVVNNSINNVKNGGGIAGLGAKIVF